MVEFREMTARLRAVGVEVDEQEAARAAMLHFARLGKFAAMEGLRSLRNYDIERARGSIVGAAWTEAKRATEALDFVMAKGPERIWDAVCAAQLAAVSRYEHLRSVFPDAIDPGSPDDFAAAPPADEEATESKGLRDDGVAKRTKRPARRKSG